IYSSLAGEVESAQASAQVAIEAARELGQPSALALALYAKGMTLLSVDPVAAQTALDQSIELTESGASDVVYANCLAALVTIFEHEGQIHDSVVTARRSIAYSDLIGDRPPVVGTLHAAGRLLSFLNDTEGVATLGGALYEGWFGPMTQIVVEDVRTTSDLIEASRSSLGEDRFDNAWRRGGSMSYEEIIAFVLQHLDSAIELFDTGDAQNSMDRDEETAVWSAG
ncbi:MAG: hypothetical protein ACRD6W_16400, partial [Nitrososphaerales archaeon]